MSNDIIRIVLIVLFVLMAFFLFDLNKHNCYEDCLNHNIPVGYVVYNKKSHIYHNPYCSSAMMCSRNCIAIPRKKAMKRGRPCSRCGG